MSIINILKEAYQAYLRQKNVQRFVRFMAIFVVFCTTYALILPAITLESGVICGLEEHVHNEQCYEMITPEPCTLAESEGHKHADACFEKVEAAPAVEESIINICGKEEHDGHTHGDDCYSYEEKLICVKQVTEGHIHTDECLGVVEMQPGEDGQILEILGNVCGQEEHEGHDHDEQCYEQVEVLTCEDPETEGHKHTDTCFEKVEAVPAVEESIINICGKEEHEAHTHSPACSKISQVLICEQTEHQHDEKCYPAKEPDETEPGATESDATESDETKPDETEEEPITTEADFTADVETAENWEASMASVTLTGDWSEDLLAIARSQLGYAESNKNYITDENGVTHGYTRYGQWYGEPYADWSTTFVSFCLQYANIPGVPFGQDCQNWLTDLQNTGIYRAVGTYNPVSGDLILMDHNGDGIADQVGIVETTTASDNDIINCQIIAGDCDGKVDRTVIDAAYHGVLGYAVLPVEPVRDVYQHTIENGIFTSVRFGEDASVPGASRLHVTELEDDEKSGQIRQALSGQTAGITLLDISFYDAADNYLPVHDAAAVSIYYPGNPDDFEQVRLFHFIDGGPVELTDVMYEKVEGDDGTGVQTKLTFRTDGFSVFAVASILAQRAPVELENLEGYYLTHGDLAVTVSCVDTENNPLTAEAEPVELKEERTSITSYVPEIEGYEFAYAILDDLQMQIADIGTVDETQYILYGMNYPTIEDDYNLRSENAALTFVYRKAGDAVLHYNLSLPDSSWFEVQPDIRKNTQMVITGETLYEVKGIPVGDTYKYIADTYSKSKDVADIQNFYKELNEAQADALTAENYLAPGAEYLFLGWLADTTDGQAVTLAPGAELTANEDGTVTAASGESTYTLHNSTVLTGQWKKLNDMVMLSVNTDTIKLSTQNVVTVSESEGNRTKTIAFGHIYNPVTYGTGTASDESNQVLSSQFTAVYDPSDTATQIVLEGVYNTETDEYTRIRGAEADDVQAYVLGFVQNDPEIAIKAGDTVLEPKAAASNAHGICWYSLQSESDAGYRLDGVLNVGTDMVYIRKNFNGLTRSQIEQLIGTETSEGLKFPLHIYDAGGNASLYWTVPANDLQQTGIFEYEGFTGSNTYTWKLHTIRGQNYAFTEADYDLDGYDCSTIISVHFRDTEKSVIYQRNTDTTQGFETVFGDLRGEEIEQVIFDSYYTSSETGMFLIRTVSEEKPLSGSILTLQNDENGLYYSFDSEKGEINWMEEEADCITGTDGTICFADLPAGTYTLMQTAAPDGYCVPDSNVWNISVDNSSEGVSIWLNETQLYGKFDSRTEIQQTYDIENVKEDGVVFVTTAFNITEEEMGTIVDTYRLNLEKTDCSESVVMKLSDAVKEADGSYSWVLRNLSGSYHISQTGFEHPNFEKMNTVATLNNAQLMQNKQEETVEEAVEEEEVSESPGLMRMFATFASRSTGLTENEQIEPKKNSGEGQYTAQIDPAGSYSIRLANTYAAENTYTLRIQNKGVDGSNLKGAIFDVYVTNKDYATDSNTTYTFTMKSTGESKTVYYVGTVDFSDSSLKTAIKEAFKSARYVLVETTAPSGYPLMDYPVILPTWNTEDYTVDTSGRYIIDVVHAKTNIEVTFQWIGDAKPNGYSGVKLYELSGDSPDLKDVTTTYGEPQKTSITSGMVYKWTNVNPDNTYYVCPVEISGYTIVASENMTYEPAGSKNVYVAEAKGTAQNRAVTITYYPEFFDIPETGGIGENRYIISGHMLILAACCLGLRNNLKEKRKRELE